jgi:hypothetical protein
MICIKLRLDMLTVHKGSMNQAGLGPTLWWGEQEEEAEEGDVEMEGAEE